MSALTAFSAAESTFFDVVAGHAERSPDQPALVALGFAPISYQDLFVQTGKIWDCLRDAGIKYGSQIGIALPSGPESAITTIAIAAHATCVPFNPRLSQSEFERELKHFNLDALIVRGRLDSPVRAAAESGLNVSPAPPVLLRKADWSSAAKRGNPSRLGRSVKFLSVVPALCRATSAKPSHSERV
jgi:oxalate---CoA ligase